MVTWYGTCKICRKMNCALNKNQECNKCEGMTWEEVLKHKDAKILIEDLERAMKWFEFFGFNVEKDKDGAWWLKRNYAKSGESVK